MLGDKEFITWCSYYYSVLLNTTQYQPALHMDIFQHLHYEDQTTLTWAKPQHDFNVSLPWTDSSN